MRPVELKGREAAFFLLGFSAASFVEDEPPTDRQRAAIVTAHEVVDGGTFRGPLVVWEMETVASELWRLAHAHR